jgi:glycine cleavage system H protein
MTVPTDLKYTPSHEWARLDPDGSVTVGITHHAQDRLGDLVYVENPAVGKRFQKGQECGVVESVKAASDIYAPVSGEVIAINEALSGNPEKVNQDAYAAWMFKLKPSDRAELDSLLDAAGYQKLIASEEH